MSPIDAFTVWVGYGWCCLTAIFITLASWIAVLVLDYGWPVSEDVSLCDQFYDNLDAYVAQQRAVRRAGSRAGGLCRMSGQVHVPCRVCERDGESR